VPGTEAGPGETVWRRATSSVDVHRDQVPDMAASGIEPAWIEPASATGSVGVSWDQVPGQGSHSLVLMPGTGTW